MTTSGFMWFVATGSLRPSRANKVFCQTTGAVPLSITSTPRSRSADSKATGSSGVTNGLTAFPASTRNATVFRGRLGSKLAQ